MTYALSRRRFLQSAAFASTSALPGVLPGVSFAADDRKLTVRFNRDLDSLDPGFYVGGHPNNDINWCCMPSLIHYGPGGWVPSPFVNSVVVRDSIHIDFELKPGLMWSNGYGELTADDVAFSYERMTTSEWKSDYVAFDRVDVTGTHTGTIVLNQPFSPFMNTTLASGPGLFSRERHWKALAENTRPKSLRHAVRTCMNGHPGKESS